MTLLRFKLMSVYPSGWIWKMCPIWFMINPNSTQFRGPPLCYRTQHALPCPDLSGLFSPLIAFFSLRCFSLQVFFFFFFCEQQKSGPEADMWNRLFFHFISFIQRYSIFSFYLKMNHKNPPTRSAVSACFFGCSVCQIYLKVFVKFCWQIGFKRPLIRFWWRSRSGI